MAEEQGALPEVIQHQRRKHEDDPGPAQRAAAEMAHIGVQRLGAGDGKKNRPEHDEAAPRRRDQQVDAVNRIERQQDPRPLHDAPDPQDRQYREPHQHDRAEQPAHHRRATALNQEQPDQQHE